MLAILTLTAMLAGPFGSAPFGFAQGRQDAPVGHVRADDPEIAVVIAAGFVQSPTFRRLVEALDRSDVIVYVRPKMRRPDLRGYLEHGVIARGGHRYLRIAIEAHGPPARLISLLGHELQHAVEVASDPNARDYQGVQRLFARLRVERFCNQGSCYETEAARTVEQAVSDEILRPRAIPASD